VGKVLLMRVMLLELMDTKVAMSALGYQNATARL
jgi:hypothetical protein